MSKPSAIVLWRVSSFFPILQPLPGLEQLVTVVSFERWLGNLPVEPDAPALSEGLAEARVVSSTTGSFQGRWDMQWCGPRPGQPHPPSRVLLPGGFQQLCACVRKCPAKCDRRGRPEHQRGKSKG